MDTSFVDLDILLTRVRNPQSRVHFIDAVKAYKAGALRAALASAWVALVYDLIAKYRELSAGGDAAATTFIQSWDNATGTRDVKKLLELERTILDDATRTTQIINPIAFKQLERLREDRHLCAHPAFSSEAELFEPSPELARLHLVNAVDLVLSQEPLQGKAIIDFFDIDVQSTGFPTARAKIIDYVEQRYLRRVRAKNIDNFGVVLVKSLLKGIPPQWNKHHRTVTSSLVAVRDRSAEAWPSISLSAIRLLDNLAPENRPHAIAFVAAFPGFWPQLQPATQMSLQETADKTASTNLTDYRILSGVTFAPFRAQLLRVIGTLERSQVRDAVGAELLKELWPRAVAIYESAGSFRISEQMFRELISPFAGTLQSTEHDQLLDAIIANGQNWDAAETPILLLGVLNEGGKMQLPSVDARNRFWQHLVRLGSMRRYDDVVTLFQTDGWVPPPREDDEER